MTSALPPKRRATAETSKRTQLIRKIQVGRRQLGLSEDIYRATLLVATKKSSLTEMSDDQLTLVLEALVKAGFKPSVKGAPDGKKSKRQSNRPGVRLIFGLWRELHDLGVIANGTRPALFAFCKRMCGVEHPDWLDNDQVNVVVEALKAMKQRKVRAVFESCERSAFEAVKDGGDYDPR